MEIAMTGKEFLHPYVRIALCVAGIAVLGYVVWQSVAAGSIYDSDTLIRCAMLAAFLVLLFRAVASLRGPRK
jgi:hypothetical protein